MKTTLQHLTRFRSPAGPGCREYYHSLRWIRTWTWICPGLWTCSCTRGSSSAPACPRCGSWTCCNLSCCRRLCPRARPAPGLWSSRCSSRPWPGFRQSECRPDPSQRPRRPCCRKLKYNRIANDHIIFSWFNLPRILHFNESKTWGASRYPHGLHSPVTAKRVFKVKSDLNNNSDRFFYQMKIFLLVCIFA